MALCGGHVYTGSLEFNLQHFISLQIGKEIKLSRSDECLGNIFYGLSTQEKGHVFIFLCHLTEFGAEAHSTQARCI